MNMKQRIIKGITKIVVWIAMLLIIALGVSILVVVGSFLTAMFIRLVMMML